MESDKIEMCKTLIEWLKTLNLKAPHANASALTDGVAIGEALNQIAPEFFSDAWLHKLKPDLGANWRLKMSNLKKIIEAVYDYYGDVLNLTLTDYPRPDSQRISEKCDMIELERLLQLILGCAVNCAEKQSYITQIMCLEESLQQNIMRALQDLETAFQGASPSRSSLSLSNFDNRMLQEERDTLAQKCFEGEKRIRLLVEDKSNLQQEVYKLQEELEKAHGNTAIIGDDGVSLGPIQTGSTRYNDLRRQLDTLKDEHMQSETAREDLKLKSQQQSVEIITMQQKIDELTKNTSKMSQLKDELDVLRESNDKIKVLESQLATCKKRLEDYNDLKKQVKLMEERSNEYMDQNAHYEEEAKKIATLKGQVELFRKEIQELHLKLDQEMNKNVKLEFDNNNLESTLENLQRNKETLIAERDALRDTIDELRLDLNATGENNVSKELQSSPGGIKEKIERLETENKALREGQGGQAALATLLDEANKRNENLREQLKTANERILSLTQASHIDDPTLKGAELTKQLKQIIELNEQKAIQLDESHSQNASLQAKVVQLETSVAQREQELMASNIRYRKCVESAKEIIKGMDPRVAAVIESNLTEKSQETSDTEPKSNGTTNNRMSELEEQLMASAFYRFGVNAQREAIDAKLALLMGQGQSFLARQRQSAPRKSVANFKK